MDLAEASPTNRFATKVRLPSGVAATAKGSRPAETRLISFNGDNVIVEMSSDIEFATTRRSPAGVGENAKATGPIPTSTEPTCSRLLESSTMTLSPVLQATYRCLPAESIASP